MFKKRRGPEEPERSDVHREQIPFNTVSIDKISNYPIRSLESIQKELTRDWI